MPRALTLPRLYAIVDAEVAEAAGREAVALAGDFVAAGVRLLQVRAKRLPGGTLLRLCEEIVAAARPAGATVIVNDRADVAKLSGADGVHVGEDDLPPEAARRVVGPDLLVGCSTHTRAQIVKACNGPVDYIAVGPVFDTATKETGYTAVGVDLVREARAIAGARPIVAIGGITLERARAVLAAGASSVAVISDLLEGDPAARVRAFLEVVGQSDPDSL